MAQRDRSGRRTASSGGSSDTRIIPGLRAPGRSVSSPLTGSESIAFALIAAAALIVVAGYLLDRVGGAFTPSLMLGIGVGAAGATLVSSARTAAWDRAETITFVGVVAIAFGWLMWIARPSFLPLGSGPDLTHHLLLINYIDRHWRLVHEQIAQ